MKAYLDTSVLVPAFLEQHIHHEPARRWLDRVASGEVEGVILCHAAAEAWAVVSVFPAPPRPEGRGLQMMVDSLLGGEFTVVEPDASMYRSALEGLQDRGLRGGVIYDALHVEAARRAGADVIVTYDVRDFRRIAPDLKDRIRKP